jgi:SAM-dependent methyltransferase
VSTCPVCGNGLAVPTHREGEHQYVRCGGCDLVRRDPLPTLTEQAALHEDYLPPTPELRRRFDLMSREVWARARETLVRRHGNGRVLDIGCGHGAFLSNMRSAGWEVLGLDVCPVGLAAARQRGIPVRHATVEELVGKDDRFDAVSAFYVIEHLADPLGFLKACREVLRPGGTLYLRFPETTPLKNLLARFGIENRLYDAPFHALDFSPRAITAALTAAGLSEVRVRVGGFTIPIKAKDRFLGVVPAVCGDLLDLVTAGRYLLPGVSKVAVARRAR